jgi:predicted DNA-binding transcriptional regulator AlpA
LNGAAILHGSIYEGNKRLRPRRASEYLGLSESTLNKWRCTGTGPRYSKLGGKIVVYDVDDLDRFAAARQRQSTSEAE